jgi:4-hydroxythreonine-4-phosphate dehydrogenase
MEEIEVITPVLDKLRAEGMHLTGPIRLTRCYAAHSRPGRCRARHVRPGPDRAEAATFGKGINVTLGLPIIRTSVDHGTALALAGTGRADPGSLLEAVAGSGRMAKQNAMKGHVARKRFGQNFLVDPGIIAAIVSAVDLRRDETVVEIGRAGGNY